MYEFFYLIHILFLQNHTNYKNFDFKSLPFLKWQNNQYETLTFQKNHFLFFIWVGL